MMSLGLVLHDRLVHDPVHIIHDPVEVLVAGTVDLAVASDVVVAGLVVDQRPVLIGSQNM